MAAHVYRQNGVREAGCAASGADSRAAPAAAEMNGRAEEKLPSFIMEYGNKAASSPGVPGTIRAGETDYRGKMGGVCRQR